MASIVCQMKDCIYRARFPKLFQKDPAGEPCYSCTRPYTLVSPVGRPENGRNTARCLFYSPRSEIEQVGAKPVRRRAGSERKRAAASFETTGDVNIYAALELSKYIVSKCVKDGHPISNLQLQKILYYIQVHFLKHSGRAAFSDVIEAWQVGPVVPNVYYYYCGCGAMPIPFVYEEMANVNEKDKNVIDGIVEAKRDMEPWILVEEIHRKDGAWDQTYRAGAGERAIISVALMKAAG